MRHSNRKKSLKKSLRFYVQKILNFKRKKEKKLLYVSRTTHRYYLEKILKVYPIFFEGGILINIGAAGIFKDHRKWKVSVIIRGGRGLDPAGGGA